MKVVILNSEGTEIPIEFPCKIDTANLKLKVNEKLYHFHCPGTIYLKLRKKVDSKGCTEILHGILKYIDLEKGFLEIIQFYNCSYLIPNRSSKTLGLAYLQKPRKKIIKKYISKLDFLETGELK